MVLSLFLHTSHAYSPSHRTDSGWFADTNCVYKELLFDFPISEPALHWRQAPSESRPICLFIHVPPHMLKPRSRPRSSRFPGGPCSMLLSHTLAHAVAFARHACSPPPLLMNPFCFSHHTQSSNPWWSLFPRSPFSSSPPHGQPSIRSSSDVVCAPLKQLFEPENTSVCISQYQDTLSHGCSTIVKVRIFNLGTNPLSNPRFI